eukprot:6174615-Pleurochrysis_carterae.AAC.1
MSMIITSLADITYSEDRPHNFDDRDNGLVTRNFGTTESNTPNIATDPSRSLGSDFAVMVQVLACYAEEVRYELSFK